MTRLNERPTKAPPEWPLQLLWMYQEILRQEQEVPRCYRGTSVLIDRTEAPPIPNVDPAAPNQQKEKRATYGLYRKALEEQQGIFKIGERSYWLLSFENPSQDRRSKQCADLLGLSVDGGLCVFECKLAGNPYAPIAAVLEGLDYLACLTSRPNLGRIQREFQEIKSSLGEPPEGFEQVAPRVEACHEVVVLAEPAYYAKYRDLDRGTGENNMATIRGVGDTVKIGFASAELDAEGFFSRDPYWSEDV